MKSAERNLPMIAAIGLPSTVWAAQTTRQGDGCSHPPFDQFNLALHVGDDRATVLAHRLNLLKTLQPMGVQQIVWLNQTHSTLVHRAEGALHFDPIEADAVITDQVGVAVVVMTADCLPLVISDELGREVACIHAGWRGLLDGVIEQTVQAMRLSASRVWLGAAIGASSFEVGQEVVDAFVAHDVQHQSAFVRQDHGRYLANLYDLARQRLAVLGISCVTGGEYCTVRDAAQFYSYRRDQQTGRMATVVCLRPCVQES
jgi:polyphenol oxidase